MFPLKKYSPLLLSFTLITTNTTPALANSCVGGDCSGGGSSLQGQLLDGRARDNTIRFPAELSQKISRIGESFDGLQDMKERFYDFTYAETTKKRFILVDRLPQQRSSDVKHDVADQLVALQRGPIVWVLQSFYERANDDDKVAFHLHEFLVSEKLRKGPLSKNDMDEVVNVTASLSDRLRGAQNPLPPQRLQELLVANNFEPGITKREQDAFNNYTMRLLALLQAACADNKPNARMHREIMVMLRLAENTKTDELASKPKRKRYADFLDSVKKSLKGDFSAKNICNFMKEDAETLRLEDELKRQESTEDHSVTTTETGHSQSGL